MAASSSVPSRGLGLVLVEFQYEYEGRDGEVVSIKPNERYNLLAKTNDHWWQVQRDSSSKPFYIPAKYVKELPTIFPSPLDFADPPAPEPASLPVTAPVPVPIPVPVPVPVPKPLEENKPKAGDEVMIRLRPDSSARHHKNENRMSTFGIPVDSYDLTPSRCPSNAPAGPTETGIPVANETTNMTEGTKQLLGLLENHRDSGNARVPSFSPVDPLPTSRTHTQPIPVDVPTVPPHSKLLNTSSSVTDPHDKQELPIEPEEEEEEVEEILQEELSTEESVSGAEEEEVRKGGDSHHIYESIQDLNLDLEALIGDKAIPAAPTEPAPSPPTTQRSLGHNLPIYANVSMVKKTSPPTVASSEPPSQPPEDPAPAPPSVTGHTPSPSPSGSSSGALSPASPVSPPVRWQTHTDQDSGKVFYYHPLTRQTTWSAPRSPPSPSSRQMDQGGGDEGIPLSPMVIPPSPQGSSVWEQLVDEVSGRFYYYNPTTGATSWTIPDLPPTSPTGSGTSTSTRPEDGPPPLPEEDYPGSVHKDNDSVFPTQSAGLIPRAHLDLKDPNGPQSKQQEFLNLPKRMVGNGVSEEGAKPAVKPWRHSVAEDTFSPSHHRNVSDMTDMNRRNSPDSPELSSRYGLKRNLSDRSTDSRQHHCHMLEKAGILNKTRVADNGKKIRKNWSQSWTVLHGGILTFHKDPKSAPTGNVSKASQIVPEYTVELRGSSVGWASRDKSSKKHVLELRTRQGCEYLMQYDTESIICDWHKVIQDTIRQLEEDHISDDEEDISDKEDKDRKRISNRTSSGPESEQSRVRTKLRRFLQRRPTLQSVKEKGYIRDNVFGCHLDTLCHRENCTIPKFVEKCVRTVERRGLDVDGIYRVSGNLAVIQKLRHKADHEEQLDLEDGQWEEIHVITGALKLFLRELPEPLFPFSCFDKFIAAIQIPDQSLRVSYMKDLVQTLPLPNYDTMELLFKHLRRVIDHKESNRMSFQSVAIVFGPTLLRPQTESPNMTIHMVFQSQIVELILKEFQTIFSQR